jgi:hypothetical protein
MGQSAATFRSRLEHDVLRHPVICANPFTAWFKNGDFSRAQARAFLIQFSVFSNPFLIAQLGKVLNAETLEETRASKEILANEIGVGFRGPRGDALLGDTEGSIEGGVFHFRAAHFELLLRMARHFDLEFADLGKRRFGTKPTLHFCDELVRLYAHDDYDVAAAASWAIENWAAAGFWDELVQGWQRYRDRHAFEQPFDMGFFTWHARLEANHARHTSDELAGVLAAHDLDYDGFVRNANAMLDAVLVFWRGLDEQRQALATPEATHAKAG